MSEYQKGAKVKVTKLVSDAMDRKVSETSDTRKGTAGMVGEVVSTHPGWCGCVVRLVDGQSHWYYDDELGPT